MRQCIIALLLLCLAGVYLPEAQAADNSSIVKVRRSRVRKGKRYKPAKAKWGKTRHTSRKARY